jgi:hypothetical protein
MTNKILKSVYTPEREAAQDQNIRDYNQALKSGDKDLVKIYGDRILHQISEQWVDVYVRPTGMLMEEKKRITPK